MQWCKADHGHGSRVTDEGGIVLAGKAIDDREGIKQFGRSGGWLRGEVITGSGD
jgi:hypothetical protein